NFERLAPVPFSVVCFRWKPASSLATDTALDAANEKLVDLVNQTGEVFLSHTRLRGRIAIRIAIGHLRTTEQHVRRAWELLQQHAAALVCRRPETRDAHITTVGRAAAQPA